jgi:sugar phosphate isomerase/epimerase
MIRSAVTVSLTPEARGGPFVYWDGLEDACVRAECLGFDAIEVFPRDITAIDAPALRNCMEKHGLRLAAVGTGAGSVVQQLRLTSPNPDERERAKAFIATIIDFAASFDAPAIIGSMQGRCDPGVPREQAVDWLVEGLESLAQRAEGEGVPLIYEPLNRYETNLFNRVGDTAEILRSLRTRNVKILADLFHMNIEEASIPDAIRQAGDLIGHVHFADSNRRAIGFGHTEMAPIAEALRAIGYDGYASAEILPLPDSDAAAQQTIGAFHQYFPR